MSNCRKSRKKWFEHDWEHDHPEHEHGNHVEEPPNPHFKHFKNCVADVLEAILEAQKKVEKDDCKVSCQQSIDELLEEKKKPVKNTIPFMLYCDCKPFKGSGVTTYYSPSKEKKFKCVETFIFKIKDIDKDCAVLELLTFLSDHKQSCQSHDFTTFCEQIDHKNVDDLIETGICINVDLACFCGITCLPAVKL